MSGAKVVDLARVRQALARLDEFAEKYPHLVDKAVDLGESADAWERELADDLGERIDKRGQELSSGLYLSSCVQL